jgi:hypothetical protein
MEPTPPDLLPQAASELILVSFVLRFVCEEPGAQPGHPATHWHGVIRHVQSSVERRFTDWGEAVAFIAEYVGLTRAA